MNKKIFLNTILACSLTMWLTACVEEDNPVKPEPASSEYVVSELRQVIDGKEETSTIHYYTYDRQGRPTEMFVDGHDSENKKYVMLQNYTYGDGEIVQKLGNAISDVYKLDDSGRIVEDIVYPALAEEPYTYMKCTYDEKGQMTSCIDVRDLVEFHWKDGDLMGWEVSRDGKIKSRATVEYTDIESEHCLTKPVYLLDNMLYARGYYGKKNRHLPLSITTTDGESGEQIDKKTYTYELTDGRVTGYTEYSEMEITLLGYHISKKSTSVYQVSWKKL